tara:strand:- start:284 stop:478 length:195 start_codon:yes stop_codon:yes gene_type:complete
MKKHINDAENNRHLEQYRLGLKRQEFTSFEVKGNYLRKETITRIFFDSGEYTDTISTETICNAT